MLANAVQFLKLIKQAATEAVEATKPVNVCFGKVTSKSPLKITVEQKMILGEKQLVLARNVTDFETKVSIFEDYGWETKEQSGGSGYEAFAEHKHKIVIDKKKITIHNALDVGDEVILIRQQNGQKYIVVDRIG